ncbi:MULTISPECIES: DUF1707 SHOCT-like domain-containing protein [Streptomyces]|nr:MULTISPECIES: DUF1707 domain-containing protein [Streptomyces]MCM3265552.1 DUF1707 domain-containing protein [Streptomyces thermoviolaceus]RSR98671.1 DUF1707 and DUF2154 domain-containing protein [Streptomyces sp. WAC00469]WTD49075.1 DUF1707 domain-containing protein [Streptomyces thermoviolaceus]GGV73828.1 hypothetical protein GCM10010499_27800 [Streptomyces thermoviolaceus subsp. apingens]GHB07493.1 hypothetical protein GCM10010512_43750 [Streptomyces thermoviolaceus subsp. thermoviolaceu
MTDEAPDLRASDADRERVAEVLRDALAEGRLDMQEFDERLEAAYKARTYGELAPLTRDLPAGAATPAVSLRKDVAPDSGWRGRIVGGDGSSSWAVAILSGFQRKGTWTMPKRFNCFAFWGGGEIDLREADFADGEVEINCVAIMGGVQVIVPPGVEVVVRGIGIMGGFDHREDGVAGEPGAPRVIVTGLAFWGGVGVERKPTRAQLARLKEQRRQERLQRRAERRELRASRRDERRERHASRRDERREDREHRREDREHRREGWA